MSANTVRLHRVLQANAETIYRAFLDADAMSKWLPPNGFTGRVHQMDARVDGSYRMSFTNFTTRQSHSFGGKYVELMPYERIRYTAGVRRSCAPRCHANDGITARSVVWNRYDGRAGRHSRGDSRRVVLPRMATVARTACQARRGANRSVGSRPPASRGQEQEETSCRSFA